MFNDQNRALARTTRAGRLGVGALHVYLDSEAGAYEAARAGWWGAAWLALGFLIGMAIEASEAGARGYPIWVVLAVDGGGALLMAGLAWLIRAKQPRWALILSLALLVASFVGSVLSLRIGFGLVITALLIWVSINAVRGAFRLAAFRAGRLTPKSAGAVFE